MKIIKYLFVSLLVIPNMNFAKAKINSAKKEKIMSEKESKEITELVKVFKKALVDFDLEKLESITVGETKEMVQSAKTSDKESKSYLKNHFSEMGSSIAGANFDQAHFSGDTAIVNGKNKSSKITIELLKEVGNWKIVSTIIDDSEHAAEEMLNQK